MPFARLRPYNGKTTKLRTYTVFGIKFQEEKGWYEVDEDVAAYLQTVHQSDGENAQDTPKAFDVVPSLDAAKQIDASERAKREATVRATADRATRVTSTRASGTLTTADLRGDPDAEFDSAFAQGGEEEVAKGSDDDEDLEPLGDDGDGEEGTATAENAVPTPAPKKAPRGKR